MYTLKQLFDSTQGLRNKVNPTASFGITNIAPVPIGNALAMEATFNALTDKSRSIYKTVIVFHGLSFSDEKSDETPLELEVFPGNVVAMQIPSFSESTCGVACTCADYYFMWWWWNRKQGSNVGPNMKPYKRKTPPPPEGRDYVNKSQSPGACKHLLRFARYLADNGWLTA